LRLQQRRYTGERPDIGIGRFLTRIATHGVECKAKVPADISARGGVQCNPRIACPYEKGLKARNIHLSDGHMAL